MWWLIGLALAGEITGKVVGPDGDPVDDALVLAYDVRFKYELDYAGNAGKFDIRDLGPGEHRVRVIPPDGVNAVEHYFDNGMPICEAEIFEVGRAETVDIGVVQLPLGGVVRGRILAPDGTPLEAATVSSRPSGVSPASLPRKGVTDVDGYFEILGVPVDNDGPLWSFQIDHIGLPLQYVGGTYLADEAQAFGVSVETVEEIGEWTALPGGVLAGEVRASGGVVVEGTVFASTTGRTRSATVVDGAFQIGGLAPGEATVWFEAAGYAHTWYPSESRPGATITVTDGQRVDDLVIQAQPEAVVRGKLVGLDDFEGVRLYLVDENRAVSLDTMVASDGSFEVAQLPAGRWNVELDPAEGMDIIDGPLVDDQGNLEVVEVGRGEELDLGPVEVPRGAVVEGRVFDRETGEPVYGAWVYVVNANTQTSVNVQSGRAGRYRAEGLPAGVYRMHTEYAAFCESDPSWVNRYYPDQRNELLTGSIPLAPGQVTKWDPEVPPDMDHDQMDDVWEARFGLDPEIDDAFEDLDGDGFPNLDEYLLGTNPAGGGADRRGCGGNRAVLLLGWIPVFLWRRKRTPACQPSV